MPTPETSHIDRLIPGLKRPAAVVLACPAGHPAVIVNPVIHQTANGPEPFPTRFWLVCPELDRKLASLEREGWIGRLRAQIANSPAWQRELAEDHHRHAELLAAALCVEWEAVRQDSEQPPPIAIARSLRRGIAGSNHPHAIKCLQAHFAFHLVCGGLIGRLLQEADPTLRLCPAHSEK